ncbi:MAG: TIGR00730 family Rossman fold protein [Micavibrio sp.]|nr:TIGR00730 family Rossman fold protein [Micavibrio sp.]|tara:strand:- start:5839 stop:6741 length:903 start_codon:yes stop_codon:yes gene_type:complete
MQDIHTYTVYLGSSGYARDVFKQSAIEMGAALGQRGKALVYGGMDAGLMGLVAKAALDNGAQVTGIIPEKIRDSERILRGLSETIMVHDLWDRKKRMFQMADIVVSLPGGYGTLDESLELLYWGYLHLHNKPLVLVNIEGYWDGLIAYLKSLPDYDERFLIVVDSTDDVFEATCDIQIPQVQPGLQARYPHFEDEITRRTHAPIIIDRASIENSYYLVCALGLKQLGKHVRPIGLLNDKYQFDDLIAWFENARDERFITDKCLGLFDAAHDMDTLLNLLRAQKDITIDLHTEKWGKSEVD